MANCMMLESTVMAPTAMSPPYFSSEELKQTAIRLSVDCMMKGDSAQGQAGQHHLGAGAAGCSRRRCHLVLLPSKELQHPHRGHRLGENGGQGRAPDPHAEGEDEDGVQHRC